MVRAYQQTSAAVIKRYGGYIAQYLGDGLLVYFGYPAAHEDDAARAVRAGLEIVAAAQDRAVGARPLAPLQIRIGIHTGPVVVGEMGGGSRHEQLALGETPNIAARVQGLAEPDSVVIGAATQRLVAGLFNCRDLGPQALKRFCPSPFQRIGSAVKARRRAAFDVALATAWCRSWVRALLRWRWRSMMSGSGSSRLELAELDLDLDLPGGGGAQEQLVIGVLAGRARLGGELLGFVHEPQEGVGIEEQPHGSPPSQKSSGSGSSKSSLMRMRPRYSPKTRFCLLGRGNATSLATGTPPLARITSSPACGVVDELAEVALGFFDRHGLGCQGGPRFSL